MPRRKLSVRPGRICVQAIGVIGTLLLHTLIALPFFIDLSLPSHRPPNKTGAGASALVSSQEPAMTVVFINEPGPVEYKAPLEPVDLASRGFALPDLRVIVLSPDSSPAADAANQEKEEDSSAPREAAGDQTQHALLYGRYMGQVQARIERAWARPRTDIGAPQFSCRARIEQNHDGFVVAIKLDHCNGGERWQQSLLSAVRTASPLPAPPDPSVYADRLWLKFESEGFRPGGSAEGFEPERRDTSVARDRHAERQSLDRLGDQLGGRSKSKANDNSNVIYLTIVGSPPEQQSARGPTNAPASQAVSGADPMTPSSEQ